MTPTEFTSMPFLKRTIVLEFNTSLSSPTTMDNEPLSFFRLPLEIRQQIYDHLFFPPRPASPPINRFLRPPPRFKRCVRFWIEGSDVLVYRSWLNESYYPDFRPQVQFLQTCKRIYEDGRDYLYDMTFFIICSSDKWNHRIRKGRASSISEIVPTKFDGTRTSRRIPGLFPSPCWMYPENDQGKWLTSLPEPPDFLGWKRGRHSYEPEDPHTDYIGTIQSCTFLKQVQHVRIGLSIRLPFHFEQVTTQFQNLITALPAQRKSTKVDLHFHDPKPSNERRYFKSEPRLDEEKWEKFWDAVCKISVENPCNWHVLSASHWWFAALRKSRLQALLDLGLPPQQRDLQLSLDFRWARDLIKQWNIPWCGECDACRAHEGLCRPSWLCHHSRCIATRGY